MDLRQIKYFVAVVEEGSITAAARRLNVVQPAVSMQLRKLEEEFGVVLFDRTARGMSLNGKAQKLYESCVHILSEVAAAGRSLRSTEPVADNFLNVGFLHSSGYGFMPAVLREVCEADPDCRVASREGYNDTLLDQLAQGVTDIAIVSSVKQNEKLPHEHLGSEQLLLVGCAGSGLADLSSMPASHLRGKRLVLTPRLRRRFAADFGRAGVEIEPSLEVESATGIFGLVRTPGWYSVLPAAALCGVDRAEYEATPVSEPTMTRSLWLARSDARPLTATGALFMRTARRILSENPYCSVAPPSPGTARSGPSSDPRRLVMAKASAGQA
ncbi:LysR family transcriptional regulator [Enterovirga rhinocerotis]|uniref:DNA-binding transcriptional LysR family regulator n=1 Tax=Enterovirga rhinocerotis TaxID=1339210 RepID=A0A4R7C6P9_9HYPH|nr:LysR family transcriptional regulator [Enterovirga rhinocerotis]TDR92915.1 DNA-binding transcriptional LysR family regulator [Enterovirga rhinocerotis]